MKVHQIKICFNVTEQILRYTYVYIIEGKNCYMVDSGVKGCQQQIIDGLAMIGRKISDIKGVFLTHAHPDHIGTAAWFKKNIGCKIYSSMGEKAWIEDVDLQFKERPIPNFYNIAGESVDVDYIVKDGDIIDVNEDFTIEVVRTSGHSREEVSYKIDGALFIGDSVPVRGDFPIYIDPLDSLQSLNRIKAMDDCSMFYPAWDVSYNRSELIIKVDEAIEIISLIGDTVNQVLEEQKRNGETDIYNELIVEKVCERLNKPLLIGNPLFARTVKSHIKSK